VKPWLSHFFMGLTPRYLSIYGSTAVVDLCRLSSFLIYTQSVGLRGLGISPSQGHYLHTEQHEHRINAHRHPWIRTHDHSFRAGEDGSALDRAATVIGHSPIYHLYKINCQVTNQIYLVCWPCRLCLTQTPTCFGLTRPSSGRIPY
jgi:hypothetical protein